MPFSKAEDKKFGAIDAIADTIGDEYDMIQYAEYPVSMFVLIGTEWYQVTTHRITSEKMVRRLNGDNK